MTKSLLGVAADKDVSEENPYVMSIGLNVLHHLGINLYSNAAAVLSEAVANAWDADSEEVHINITPDRIEIIDTGCGMGVDDINARFLMVGYDKRSTQGDTSDRGRHYMGRKGIGKLSLFSIADEVEIQTKTATESHGFRMKVAAILDAIDSRKTYHPEKLAPTATEIGTKIILTSLKKKRVDRTAIALRKRIARRFSVIGYQRATDKFDVSINGEKITRADREDLRNVEFMWVFQDSAEIPDPDCPALKKKAYISSVVGGNPNWKVTGWLGTVAEPKQLSTEDAGAMNNVIVLSRGRLIQENILDKINFSRILSNYLTGQIEADFLDITGSDDIATSDRQRLIEDDERYRALVIFLRATVVAMADNWTAWRNEARGKDAVNEIKALKDWILTLGAGQRKPAEKMLGVIRGIQLEDESDRRDLYKSGMLAFERLRLRENAHQLGELDNITVESLLPLLADLSDLEGALYRDIVKSRIDVIKRFENLVDANVKEKILQQHLFENLWLLDPGWDRATENTRIEKSLKADYAEFNPDLSEEESKGRYDIRYRNSGGMHILVELKRADRQMHLDELRVQGEKYVGALRRCLTATGEPPTAPISIVFVLGKPVYEELDTAFGKKYVDDSLKLLNARIVYFEELIKDALNSYSDYLDQSAKFDKIEQIINQLDAPPILLAAPAVEPKPADAQPETLAIAKPAISTDWVIGVGPKKVAQLGHDPVPKND